MENDNWQEIDQSRNCPMHGVLSRDNEIKEQFPGRWLVRSNLLEDDNWQEIDQSRNCPMHGVLSRDNEIKEQFLGRWLEIEPKVSQTCRLTKACQVIDSGCTQSRSSWWVRDVRYSWDRSLNNIVGNFLKYTWVGKYIKMCVMLFKN